MRSVSVVLILALVAIASAAPAGDKPHYDLNKTEEYFEKYIKDFHKVYKNDADREAHYRAFADSLKQINKLNEESDSATFGINNFTDYTEEERKNMLGLRID
uniref:Cathepsin propeptide inhibitor domain-containing protein n=1 Tax=Heliothis virescens TaxID=7102 RepID=A0A2A4J449_HELVI